DGCVILLGALICEISIHAPREGSDWSWPCKRQTSPDFYPRSPRGERRPGSLSHSTPMYFYPRSPRGERPSTWSSMPKASYFYPRSPRGERPFLCPVTE